MMCADNNFTVEKIADYLQDIFAVHGKKVKIVPKTLVSLDYDHYN